MRAKPRNGPSLGPGRRRRLRLVCQSQPLFLGVSPARDLRARRHTPRDRAHVAQGRRARRRAASCSRAASRQGGEILLGDKGYAGRAFAKAVSDLDATIVRPAPPRRARPRAASRADPPAHREHLLDLQRHPHPRTPRRPHPPRPARTRPAALASASPPPSRSTTNSAAPAAPSSTTAPNRAESTI